MNPKTKKIAITALTILGAIVTFILNLLGGGTPDITPEKVFEVTCCPPGKESPMFFDECAAYKVGDSVECINKPDAGS